jgi:hypothetical protein
MSMSGYARSASKILGQCLPFTSRGNLGHIRLERLLVPRTNLFVRVGLRACLRESSLVSPCLPSDPSLADRYDHTDKRVCPWHPARTYPIPNSERQKRTPSLNGVAFHPAIGTRAHFGERAKYHGRTGSSVWFFKLAGRKWSYASTKMRSPVRQPNSSRSTR